MNRRGDYFLSTHFSQKEKGRWIFLDGRQSIGGFEGQAKVIEGWNSVDKNVDVYLHS